MTLLRKIQEVEAVYKALDVDVKTFQAWSGLGCKSGCGECCKSPQIEASVLEFIPLAFHLFKEGKVDEFLDRLEHDPKDPICKNFQPILRSGAVGNCENYAYRGLVCRAFGFTAKTDKNGQPFLSTCKIIKTETAEAYQATAQAIGEGATVPITSNYYMRLRAIDYNLTDHLYPINEAMRLAIMHVSFHFTYEESPLPIDGAPEDEISLGA